MSPFPHPPPSANLPPPLPYSRRRRPRPIPYLPPFRQRRIDAARPASYATDSTVQHRCWTAMKKRINGVINRLNQNNVAQCALDLFRINLVRGRGLFCRAVLRAQLASPDLSPVFAALVAVVGSRMPNIAELLLRRLLTQYRSAYKNQDRTLAFATARFLAHLFNQQVVTELLLLELLFTCILNPSDGSIELAVATLRECAVLLAEKSPKGLEDVFERLRQLLHDGDLNKRAQVMIEDLMQMRRSKFQGVHVIPPSLDLLDEADIITHFISLQEKEDADLQDHIDEFHFDPDYDSNENEYVDIKKSILGAAMEDDNPAGIPRRISSTSSVESDERGLTVAILGNPEKRVADKPKDMTDAELIKFRRDIYLIISSSISYEEWAHKLLNLMNDHPKKQPELCRMIIECCSHEKTFLRGYALLGQRLCMRNKAYVSAFEDSFASHYATIHKFDARKIRNIARFFASLLAADALPWTLFQLVRIVEDETTASSRIFLKILFQDVASSLGTKAATDRFKLAQEKGHLDGIFPTDKPDNTRFAVGFFTSIFLGYLVEPLQKALEAMPNPPPKEPGSSSSASSSSLSSSSSSELSESSGEEPSDLHSNPYITAAKKPKTPSRNPSEAGDPPVRDSPQVDIQGPGGISYAEVEENHRAYVSASTLSGTKRAGPDVDDRDSRNSSERKRRRYDSPPRDRYRRRSYRNPREPYDYWQQDKSDDAENERSDSPYRRRRSPTDDSYDNRNHGRRPRERTRHGGRRHRSNRSRSPSPTDVPRRGKNDDALYSNSPHDRHARRKNSRDSEVSQGRYERRRVPHYSR